MDKVPSKVSPIKFHLWITSFTIYQWAAFYVKSNVSTNLRTTSHRNTLVTTTTFSLSLSLSICLSTFSYRKYQRTYRIHDTRSKLASLSSSSSLETQYTPEKKARLSILAIIAGKFSRRFPGPSENGGKGKGGGQRGHVAEEYQEFSPGWKFPGGCPTIQAGQRYSWRKTFGVFEFQTSGLAHRVRRRRKTQRRRQRKK